MYERWAQIQINAIRTQSLNIPDSLSGPSRGAWKKLSALDILLMETVLAYSLRGRKRVQDFSSKDIPVEPEVGQNAALEVALIAVW